jgi:hypothetical protein
MTGLEGDAQSTNALLMPPARRARPGSTQVNSAPLNGSGFPNGDERGPYGTRDDVRERRPQH